MTAADLRGEHVEVVLRHPLQRVGGTPLYALDGVFAHISVNRLGDRYVVVLGADGAFAFIPHEMVGVILSDGEHPMVRS